MNNLKKVKKTVLFSIGLMLITSMAFISQSCDFNEDEFANNPISSSRNLSTKTNLANSRTLMIDSISESDEFLDFEMACIDLSQKFYAYTSILSQEKFEELMNNINNDDYMQDIVNKVGISSDLQKVAMKKNDLLLNDKYKKLKKEEQRDLFFKNSVDFNSVIVKTRTEILNNKCIEQYNSDVSYANSKCSLGILACACLISSGPGACVCVVGVLTIHSDDLRMARRNLEECQNK